MRLETSVPDHAKLEIVLFRYMVKVCLQGREVHKRLNSLFASYSSFLDDEVIGGSLELPMWLTDGFLVTFFGRWWGAVHIHVSHVQLPYMVHRTR